MNKMAETRLWMWSASLVGNTFLLHVYICWGICEKYKYIVEVLTTLLLKLCITRASPKSFVMKSACINSTKNTLTYILIFGQIFCPYYLHPGFQHSSNKTRQQLK